MTPRHLSSRPLSPADVDAREVPRTRPRPPSCQEKKVNDLELAIKLRNNRVITTPGEPFEASDAKEIEDLFDQGVFRFEKYDPTSHGGERIFKSRRVGEVKAVSSKPYEKSRLVIQGHNDKGKDTILTQSPTI